MERYSFNFAVSSKDFFLLLLLTAVIVPFSVIITVSGLGSESRLTTAQEKTGGCGDPNQCRAWEVFQNGCCRAVKGSGCTSSSDCQIGLSCVGGICGGEDVDRCGGEIWQCAFGPEESRCINGKEYKCGSDLCLKQVKDYCGSSAQPSPATAVSSDFPIPTPTMPARSVQATATPMPTSEVSDADFNLGDREPVRTCSGTCIKEEPGKPLCAFYGVWTAGGYCPSSYLCCSDTALICSDGTKVGTCSNSPSRKGYRCEYNPQTNTMVYVPGRECGFYDCKGECLYFDPGATCSDYGRVEGLGECGGNVACCGEKKAVSSPTPPQYLPIVIVTRSPQPTPTIKKATPTPVYVPRDFSEHEVVYREAIPTPRPIPTSPPAPKKTIFDTLKDLFTVYQKYLDYIYGLYGVRR